MLPDFGFCRAFLYTIIFVVTIVRLPVFTATCYYFIFLSIFTWFRFIIRSIWARAVTILPFIIFIPFKISITAFLFFKIVFFFSLASYTFILIIFIIKSSTSILNFTLWGFLITHTLHNTKVLLVWVFLPVSINYTACFLLSIFGFVLADFFYNSLCEFSSITHAF